MPKILDRLVAQLMANGKSREAAYAIATKSLQRSGNLEAGSNKPTAKGIERGEMTPAQRARDRAAKERGGSLSDYKYNKYNNSAVKGNINPNVKRRA
jgi:hypothetical protein